MNTIIPAAAEKDLPYFLIVAKMYLSSTFHVLMLILISDSRAAKVKWDVAFPQTATQDFETEYYSRNLPTQEELYTTLSPVTVPDGCLVDCER